MSEIATIVMVYPETKFWRYCGICGDSNRRLVSEGHLTEVAAVEAAAAHVQAHLDQPYCRCETYCTALDWDDDDPHVCGDDCGHTHCGRHDGPCCDCGCLTKTPRPAPSAEPGDPT